MAKRRRLTDEQRTLVENNIGLVPTMVRHVAERSGYRDWDALHSEAQLAICMAATTWQPDRAKFSTYACNAMIFTMRRHINRERKRPEMASLEAVTIVDANHPTQHDRHVQATAVVDELCLLLLAVDPRARAVMIEVYAHEQSHRAVAERIGMSTTTVSRSKRHGMRIARQMAERLCA